MKKLCLLVLLFSFALTGCTALNGDKPVEYTSNGFTYIVLDDGTAEITGYNSYQASTVLIPETLGKYHVTSIRENAFNWYKLSAINVSENHPVFASIDGVLFNKTTKTLVCYPLGKHTYFYQIPQGILHIGNHAFSGCHLERINLADSIISIGDDAFSSCNSLTYVNIPDGVISIGNRAFSGCDKLYSISIPNSVTTIGEEAFTFTNELESIRISADHPIFSFENGALFNKQTKTLMRFFDCKTNYEVPQGILHISDSAFENHSCLISVSIPDSVTTIGRGAFYLCKNLTSVTILGNITAIEDATFLACENLTSVTLPDSVTSIGAKAFQLCMELRTINLPNKISHIGDRAFCQCSKLTNVNISDSVTFIGEFSFGYCPNLTLSLPRNSYAEKYCRKNNLPYTFVDDDDWLLE